MHYVIVLNVSKRMIVHQKFYNNLNLERLEFFRICLKALLIKKYAERKSPNLYFKGTAL